MDTLARYYTQEKISRLLINKLDIKRPKKILELAIGDGSLSLAAFERWNEARYYGVDIDDTSIINIKKNLPFVDVINFNGLEDNINVKLNIKSSSIDIAICNPPYLKHTMSEEDKALFKKVKLESCFNNKQITTDIVFLARNLMFLRDGRELGIILPDSVMTNHYYNDLRKDLLFNHNIKCIIQLPDNIFNKTEARTHILIIQKNIKTNTKVELSKANNDGDIIQSLYVNKEDLVHRMDFDFHFWALGLESENKNNIRLGEITDSICRGNRTKKYLDQLELDYFHTTSFTSNNSFVDYVTKKEDFPENITLAEPGDILVSRVGKRCIGNIAMVKSGYIPITDCIYRVRPCDSYGRFIFNSFTSDKGQAWFQAYAHGVCARVISKTDLINFLVEMDGVI
ncbi:N-6 DNA methylase [Paenibacillus taichungensis]